MSATSPESEVPKGIKDVTEILSVLVGLQEQAAARDDLREAADRRERELAREERKVMFETLARLTDAQNQGPVAGRRSASTGAPQGVTGEEDESSTIIEPKPGAEGEGEGEGKEASGGSSEEQETNPTVLAAAAAAAKPTEADKSASFPQGTSPRKAPASPAEDKAVPSPFGSSSQAFPEAELEASEGDDFQDPLPEHDLLGSPGDAPSFAPSRRKPTPRAKGSQHAFADEAGGESGAWGDGCQPPPGPWGTPAIHYAVAPPEPLTLASVKRDLTSLHDWRTLFKLFLEDVRMQLHVYTAFLRLCEPELQRHILSRGTTWRTTHPDGEWRQPDVPTPRVGREADGSMKQVLFRYPGLKTLLQWVVQKVGVDPSKKHARLFQEARQGVAPAKASETVAEFTSRLEKHSLICGLSASLVLGRYDEDAISRKLMLDTSAEISSKVFQKVEDYTEKHGTTPAYPVILDWANKIEQINRERKQARSEASQSESRPAATAPPRAPKAPAATGVSTGVAYLAALRGRTEAGGVKTPSARALPQSLQLLGWEDAWGARATLNELGSDNPARNAAIAALETPAVRQKLTEFKPHLNRAQKLKSDCGSLTPGQYQEAVPLHVRKWIYTNWRDLFSGNAYRFGASTPKRQGN